MPDIGFRDSDKMFPRPRGPDRAAAPSAPPPSPIPAGPIAPETFVAPSSASPARAAGTPSGPGAPEIFAEQPDALGVEAALRPVAEMIAHRGTQTPLAAGLFGRSGTGKTHALNLLTDTALALSAAARAIPNPPFLARMLAVRIDAANLDADPATGFAGALYAALFSEYPACALEAMQAGRDPRIEAREAFERLDVARRKLDAERAALDEADARRARLTEFVLYEAAGSQIDSYAASNRNRIKSSLSAIGVSDDPMLRFKEMVRAVAQASDGGRAGFSLRAFWAPKGQTRLLVTAALLLLSGVGLGVAVAEQTTWLGWLRANDGLAAAAAWLQNHMDWLLTLRQVAYVGAAAALALNLWRALRLIQLVLRGDSLLRADVAGRRRDADGRFAHHVRRAEALAAECDMLARRAAEAEQRAGGLPIIDAAQADAAAFAGDPVKLHAQRFIASVGAFVNGATKTSDSPKAPQRIIVAIDNLDAAPLSRARALLHSARALFGPGFATLVAADPARYAEADGARAQSLDWIDVPLQIGAIPADDNFTILLRAALAGTGAATQTKPVVDARSSRLDAPLPEAEAQLLEALAPFAASSARTLKRFVYLYRLARAHARSDFAALAFMLALEAGGAQTEIAAVKDALSPLKATAPLDVSRGGDRVANALAAARSAQGGISADALRRAAATARIFSFNA